MLTQAQLDQFHRDGFAVVPQVVGGAELDLLRLAADRVEADGISGRGEHHYHTLTGGVQLYFGSDQVWERDPVFAATTVHPGLLAVVGQCLGHPFLPLAASFWCSQRFGNHPLGWHQAPPYGERRHRHTFPLPHFAAWLCLDAATTENGCCWSLPGYHLTGHLNLEFGIEEELYQRARPLEMAAGDLLLLATAAPRACRGNRSARTWRVLQLDYLARPVLEALYPERQGAGQGFGPQTLGLAREMVQGRQAQGLVDAPALKTLLGEEGFVFSGAPSTPPGHWAALIARFSSDEIRRRKHLLP